MVTRATVDPSPTILLAGFSTSGVRYSAFGALVFNRNLDERLAFTGHERDDDGTTDDAVDLDYMHARYYSSAQGRPDLYNQQEALKKVQPTGGIFEIVYKAMLAYVNLRTEQFADEFAQKVLDEFAPGKWRK